MKMVVVFSVDVPEDSDEIRGMMNTICEAVRDRFTEEQRDRYHLAAYVGINESAEAVLDVFNDHG